MKRVVLAGEGLPSPLVREIMAAAPGVKVANIYGPTETVVVAEGSAGGLISAALLAFAAAAVALLIIAGLVWRHYAKAPPSAVAKPADPAAIAQPHVDPRLLELAHRPAGGRPPTTRWSVVPAAPERVSWPQAQRPDLRDLVSYPLWRSKCAFERSVEGACRQTKPGHDGREGPCSDEIGPV